MSDVAPPPAYIHGDSPPSYDEVVRKVDGLVGSNPTPEKYFEVGEALTQTERDVLRAGAVANNPIKTDADKKKFAVGAAKALSRDNAKQVLKKDAETAAKAAKNIEEVFTSLQLKIGQIDQVHKSEFMEKLRKHRDDYRKVLEKSRLLAADISQHGTSFDEVIMKFCGDNRLSIDQRLSRINGFIADAEKYQQSAKDIKNEFDGLINKFAGFVAEFSNWAKDKEGELSKDIEEIEKELIELKKTLSDLLTALYVLTGGVVVGVPVMGIGAIFGGPAAPFFMIGGLIYLGASAAAIVGLGIFIKVTKGEIEGKERRRDELQKQVEHIRRTRQELTQLGEEKYKVFAESIQCLASYWTCVMADAEKIKKWLEDGANDAEKCPDYPEYMEMNLKFAVKVYAAMSEYMDAYAKGIGA